MFRNLGELSADLPGYFYDEGAGLLPAAKGAGLAKYVNSCVIGVIILG
jgi:hypothetical protein